MATEFFKSGFATDTITDVICLWARFSTSGNVSTYRRSGATSGYQVTSGKTFYITKIIVACDAASENYAIPIGYADNDVGMNTTTARTNPVAVLGDPEQTTLASGAGGVVINPTVNSNQMPAVNAAFSSVVIKSAISQKYLYSKFIGSATATMMGLIIFGFEA